MELGLYFLMFSCLVVSSGLSLNLPNEIYAETGRFMINPPVKNEITDDENSMQENDRMPFDTGSLVKENPNANAEGEEKQWPLNPWREEKFRDYRTADKLKNMRVRRADNNVLIPVDLETFRKEQPAPIPVLVKGKNRNFLKCREKYKSRYRN